MARNCKIKITALCIGIVLFTCCSEQKKQRSTEKEMSCACSSDTVDIGNEFSLNELTQKIKRLEGNKVCKKSKTYCWKIDEKPTYYPISIYIDSCNASHLTIPSKKKVFLHINRTKDSLLINDSIIDTESIGYGFQFLSSLDSNKYNTDALFLDAFWDKNEVIDFSVLQKMLNYYIENNVKHCKQIKEVSFYFRDLRIRDPLNPERYIDLEN